MKFDIHKINIRRMNDTIRVIKEIRELICQHNVNSKKEKHRRHTPLSPQNSIRYDTSTLSDSLILQIGNGNPTEFFNVHYNKKYPNSFSLSELTLDEHRNYIYKKLGEIIDYIKLLRDNTQYDKEPLYCNNFYKDVTTEFKDTHGRLMYSKAYKLNIFPPFSFYQEATHPTMIATTYIIAIDNDDKNLNIFFSGTKTFDVIHGREHNLQEQIYKFNLRNQNIPISPKIWIIYYNLIGFFGGYSIVDRQKYEKKIIEIDEPPYIFKNNTLCGFGWDVSDFIFENTKMSIKTTNNDTFNFSTDIHTIKNEHNKKILHI